MAIVAGTRGLAFAAVLMLSPFVSQEAMLRPIDNVKAHDHAREATVADRDVARVHRMLTRHDCWTTAETAAHPGAPGRALVALPDARPTLVDAATGFAIWNGTEDGVLYAFCR